jgi:hypothetical protein
MRLPILLALAGLALPGLVLPGPARAQSPALATPGVGMGRAAFDGLACGADALAANPAALARACPGPVRILLLPTVGLEAVDNGAGSAVWRHRQALLDAVDGESFTAMDPAARDDILASIPAEGYLHRMRIQLPIAQAGLGRQTAVSLSLAAESEGRITRDLAELALLGYEQGRTVYQIDGTDERAAAYWTLALGHGRTVGGFEVGATARAMSGTFLTRWQAFDPEVSVIQGRVTGTMVGAFAGDKLFSGELFSFRPPDGFGWGVDVGAMRQVGPVRVGAAIQNLLHGMHWTDETHLRTLTLVGTLGGTEFDSEDSVYDPATASAQQARVARQMREDARFPRRFRASATVSPAPLLTLAAGAMFLGAGELDRDWDQRLSLGGQVAPLPFLRFQAGLATDLDGAGEMSGGLEMDLARTRLGIGAARIQESGGLGGWRLLAGLSRF